MAFRDRRREYAIIGIDFLCHYGLLVDPSKQTFSRFDHESVNDRAFGRRSSYHGEDSFRRVGISSASGEYPELTRPPVFRRVTIKHNVKHYIKTTPGPPVYSKLRRLAPDRFKEAKTEFDLMIEQGVIRPSKNPWAFPLHVVPKKDGSLRPCGDYRALNARTIPDRYSPPHIEDVAQRLHKKRVFSKVDLVRAYHQIPVAQRRRKNDNHDSVWSFRGIKYNVWIA